MSFNESTENSTDSLEKEAMKEALKYSAGFMSKSHGKNQTNQPLEIKLKKDQRMKEESQRSCRSSPVAQLSPAPKQFLANQYSWTGGEALLQQTF